MGSKVDSSPKGFSSLRLGTHPDGFGVPLATGTWHVGAVGLWVLLYMVKNHSVDWTV